VTMHSSSVGGLRFLELWNRAEAVGRLRPVERDRPTQLHKGRMLALINNHLQNEFLLSVLLTGKKKKKDSVHLLSLDHVGNVAVDIDAAALVAQSCAKPAPPRDDNKVKLFACHLADLNKRNDQLFDLLRAHAVSIPRY